MTTALIYDEISLAHEVPAGHPEAPERLRAIMRLLQARVLLDHPNVVRLASRPATDDELAAVHTRAHIATIEAAAQQAQPGHLHRLDPDTYVGPRSAAAARMGAGAVLVGVDAVLSGSTQNAFALVRPPGHHAEADIAMGFCLYNNVAVAARYAQQRYGVGKVLIVDFDVHHGNGTQAIFYADPSVAYFSTHQAPFYPGTGLYDEVGAELARFTTCNAPVPAATTFDLYDAIFREVLYPFADRFRPDLILLSAGYDTHWRDPMAGVLLDVMGQAVLTRYVQDLANRFCGDKLVVALEGGYDPAALAEGVAASLEILLGEPEIIDTIGPPDSPGFRWNAEAVTEQLRQVQELGGFRRRPRLPGPAPEPHDDDDIAGLLPRELREDDDDD